MTRVPLHLCGLLFLAACGKEVFAPPNATVQKLRPNASSYTAAEQASIDSTATEEAGTQSMELEVLGSSTRSASLGLTPQTQTVSLWGRTQTTDKHKGAKVTYPSVSPDYYPLGDCTMDYIDCVQKCEEIRIDFQNATGDFWRADDDFWQNTLTGRFYLNNLPGGPSSALRNSYYLLGQYRNQFANLGCKKYVG